MDTLDPKQVFLIQIINKDLPFRYKQAGWSYRTKDNPDGNIYVTESPEKIIEIIKKVDKPIIIVDDLQYLSSNFFMRSVVERKTGNQQFEVFNNLAHNLWSVLSEAAKAEPHKRVYFFSHTQQDTNTGNISFRTIGKLMDEKIVVEGLFTVVLRSQRVNGNYIFSTQTNGADTCKSPKGMFSEETIPNDLAFVDKCVCEYYEIGNPAAVIAGN
jgi:hypothetical protein